MKKEIISTDKAPAAIGPYSQAVKLGEFVFISGQIAIDPQSGELIKGDVQEQAHLAISNLKAILEEAGTSLEKVVKTTVFILTMDDFPKVNEVYQKYFLTEPPARACVAVKELPKGAGVEIEAIAAI